MAERVSVERAVEVLWHRGAPDHPRWSVGSGFLIGGDRVLTAAHNVGPGTLLVRVDGPFEHATEIATDASAAGLDLAVVHITGQPFFGPRRWVSRQSIVVRQTRSTAVGRSGFRAFTSGRVDAMIAPCGTPPMCAAASLPAPIGSAGRWSSR
jgi:hypothetical protein